MTSVLHLVRQPAVALDRFGFVIETNAIAEDIFDHDIRIRDRRLFTRDKRAELSLHQLVDQLRTTPYTAALPVSPIVVRRETKHPVIIRMLPVDGAACGPFLGARVILTLSVPGQTARSETAVFSEAFGLTPAEARLAAFIATGASLERASHKLVISRETARTQSKALFVKTGTHRQPELVALLNRI